LNSASDAFQLHPDIVARMGNDPQPTKDDAAPTLLALAGGVSGAVKLYSVADGDDLGACVATMPLPRATGGGDGGKGAAGGGSSRFAHSIAFSPDGRRIVCGAMDGTVAVFDVPSRKLLHTLEGHAMPVRGVCFSVDSKTAFTACDDGYVHAYDVETRRV
jgi:WD repeat-containing protein 61